MAAILSRRAWLNFEVGTLPLTNRDVANRSWNVSYSLTGLAI